MLLRRNVWLEMLYSNIYICFLNKFFLNLCFDQVDNNQVDLFPRTRRVLRSRDLICKTEIPDLILTIWLQRA